jgi:hypothetical protein
MFLIFPLLQRLFFLNGEQDLSAFLLVDIGLAKYPNYICHASHQIFSDRCHLLAYEEVNSFLFLLKALPCNYDSI